MPLDRSSVQSIVERELPGLRARLGLEAWEIGWTVTPSSTDGDGHLLRGECTRLVDYHSASIVLNNEAFSDEEQVLRTLRHELFHVVLAPWDLYTSAVERVSLGADGAAVLDRVREHAVEHAVIALERMWSGLNERACP
jgi:hypothetical protein